MERWALNDLWMWFDGTSRGRTPAAPQDPLTFSALAAVGVGAVHALGAVLAGGAGTLVNVKLAQVPVEAWKEGEVTSRTRQVPSLLLPSSRGPASRLGRWVSMGMAAGGPECGAATHH